MSCRFCQLHEKVRKSGGIAPLSYHVDGGEELVVAVSQRAVVVVARGSLAPGYLLIIPSTHCHSLFELDVQERGALLKLARAVAALVGEVFGEASYVEHGATSDGEFVGGCIPHCHINVFPIAISQLVNDCLGESSSIRNVNSFELVAESGPYLLFGDAVEDDSVARIEDTRFIRSDQIPSQLVRRWWAKKIAPDIQYDWRLDPQLQNAIVTFERSYHFASELRKMLGSWPASDVKDEKRIAINNMAELATQM